MSQKEGKFQSKPRSGGGKFGGKAGGGGRGPSKSWDKPRSGGFGKKFEGDRGERSYGDRKPRGDFGDRKPRSFGDRDRSGPSSDRPYKKREGGFDRDRKPRGDFGDRKPRSFGDRDRSGPSSDRPYKKREGGFDRDRKPRGDFGDRKPRDDRGGDKPYKKANRFSQKPFQRYEDKPRFSKKQRATEGADELDSFGFDSEPAEVTAETRHKLKSERTSFGAPSSAFLYGVHAVTEALKNPKRLHQRLLVTQRGYEAIVEAYQAAQDDAMTLPQVSYVEKEDIDRLLPRDAVHQDILLDTQPLEEVFLQDILNTAGDNAKILVLDQVTDPHNVGAILRSAAAFGALAVVVQKLHAPDITGTLAKAASGAVEHVPMVREVNLSRALEQLKEAGFTCFGLAERGKRTFAEVKPSGKVAIVLGAEGDGLRRLVAENCDELVRLPTQGQIGSLNVSNAAAVALYELSRG